MKKPVILVVILSLNLIMLSIGCIDNNRNNKFLSINYDKYSINYTIEELESIESYSGIGGYLKTKLLPDNVVIEGVNSYTGVKILTLLNLIPNLPKNYNITVFSSDGWSVNFSKNECMGYVDIYNSNGNIVYNQTAVMILAYKEDGDYYKSIAEEDDIGPFRIAFVGDGFITSSNLWSRNVVSIHINKI